MSFYLNIMVVSILYICCSPKLASVKSNTVVFEDRFDSRLDTTIWKADLGKGGTNSCNVFDGKMVIDVDQGATIWCNILLGEQWQITFDRTIPLEGKPNDRLSDFNVFWQATDPNGKSVYGRNPLFSNYDELMLYYVGFGGHNNTKTRFRKYMGDSGKDVIQEYTDTAHLLAPNTTYHCKVVMNKDQTYFYINGQLYFEYTDSSPYSKGYFGFRTTQSRHLIDNFKITKL